MLRRFSEAEGEGHKPIHTLQTLQRLCGKRQERLYKVWYTGATLKAEKAEAAFFQFCVSALAGYPEKMKLKH